MKYFKILALVGAIMLTCVNNSEAKAASWEKSFILDENSRDIKLMSNEENPWSDYDIRDDLEKEFKVSSNEIEYDYSRAFIQWDVSMRSGFTFDEWYSYWREEQSGGAWQENYDGMPYYLNSERHIMLPVVIAGQRKAIVEVYNSRPGLDEFPLPSDGLLGGGPTVLYSDWMCGIFTSSLDEYYIFAEEAYNAVTAQGATVKKIIYTDGWPDENNYMGISPIYAVTVEDDCKGYMYNARTDQLFTFDEFHTILMNGRWPFYVNTLATPSSGAPSTDQTQHTLSPQFSPTAATPYPTVTVSTATPSSEQTASPMLTAAASLLPSPPAESNSSAADAVFIVLGVILCCAAAGGIVWAAISARKKKAGK